jgi:hypothetical protein
VQLILFLVFCLAFWFGGREVSKGNISFEDMMKAGVAFPRAVAFLRQAAPRCLQLCSSVVEA